LRTYVWDAKGATLQWGRDQSITERAYGKVAEEYGISLQWGRDQSITEREQS